MQRKSQLWSQTGLRLLRELPLQPRASCRREDLLGLLAMLDQQIGNLDRAVQQAAEVNPQAKLVMTQPGVGPNTALAFVLTIGDVARDRKSTRLNSSHVAISYAVFCLKKKKTKINLPLHHT